ncbi:BTAD domain-containing putative transcriptional regulator [Spirillospora sp. NPDC048819]|uniref:AfsR/SARP family transcriptional regulator n=1 Tax=Spirillospora sp. NPDC048819 TaxID=3155268 RepID=UPI0033E2A5FB
MRYLGLGPLSLRAGDEWESLGPTKWRVLLAVLLCHANQPVSAERLLDEIWGTCPPQSARKVLQGYVSRLRRMLRDDSGQILVTQRLGYQAQGYRLVVGEDDYDVHRFDQLAEEGLRQLDQAPDGAVATLSAALELWRGAPFEDVPSAPTLDVEKARLQERRVRILEAKAKAELTLGRHEMVLPQLESLVAEHPLRESLRALFMTALYRAGRQAEALAAYRELRGALVEELGVEPVPSVQRLYERILKGDTELSPPRPRAHHRHPVEDSSGRERGVRQLPPASTTFTGRRGEIATIRTLLTGQDEHAMPIVAIDGPGGVGKSAVAIHAGHALADRFPDGQIYVDLHGTSAGTAPLDPNEALGRFLRALGMKESGFPVGTEERSALFRSLTANRRLLVVLDNAAGTEQVRPLFPAGAGCAVLVTCRTALTTLDGAAHLHMAVLPTDQAVELLERLVGGQRARADAEAADAAREIVRLCGRLPLALRIAGARLAARPRWSLRDLVDRLGDARSRLDELRIGDLAVRTGFELGYSGFRTGRAPGDLEAARAFRLLGVVPGPDVSLWTAAALLAMPMESAEDALERLVDANLLESPAPARYAMHDLLRLFARERAEQEESEADRSAALERVLSGYLSTARRAVAILDPKRPWPDLPVNTDPLPLRNAAEAKSWLRTEHPNLIATVSHALTGSGTAARHGILLAQTLQWLLFPRGHAQELLAIDELAVQAARRLGDPHSEALALDHLAGAYWLHQRYDDMRAALETAIAVWRRLGDRQGEQRSLCNLADALTELGHYDDAIAVQKRQLAIADERGDRGDREAMLIGLGNLGRSQRGLGRLQDALASFERSLEYASEIGDLHYRGFALYEIGVTYLALGRYGEARAHMDEALPVWKSPEAGFVWRGRTWSALVPWCARFPTERIYPAAPAS